MEKEKKTISVHIEVKLDQGLLSRGSNRSEVLNRDLGRLYDIYRYELSAMEFSPGEARLLAETLKYWHPDAGMARHLWNVVDDAIRLDRVDEKYGTDGQALVKKLRGLSISQALAITDAIERYWQAVARGRQPALEDYLPVKPAE